MRVAIIGAGLAGLACAHELERLGLLPVIFERQRSVGRPDLVIETMAQVMHHNRGQDIFDHIRQDLGLPLNPHGSVQSMILHSPNHEATLQGHLGYITIRGHDDRSLERQLARVVAAEIHYGQRPDPWELRRQFDWVVVATGNHEWSQTVSRWTPHIDWSVRGATVIGSFNPAEQHFFFNPRYAKTGYAMISPIDERSAVVGVGVPGASGNEADQYWAAFRQDVGHYWEREVASVRVDRVQVGQPSDVIVGNVILIGHAGGFCEPIGMTGQCPSLTSGVCAARQIVLGDRSLSRFARHFRSYYNQALRIRQTVNAWTDKEMDRLVQTARFAGPVVTSVPLPYIRMGGWALDALRAPNDPSPEIGRY